MDFKDSMPKQQRMDFAIPTVVTLKKTALPFQALLQLSFKVKKLNLILDLCYLEKKNLLKEFLYWDLYFELGQRQKFLVELHLG